MAEKGRRKRDERKRGERRMRAEMGWLSRSTRTTWDQMEGGYEPIVDAAAMQAISDSFCRRRQEQRTSRTSSATQRPVRRLRERLCGAKRPARFVRTCGWLIPVLHSTTPPITVLDSLPHPPPCVSVSVVCRVRDPMFMRCLQLGPAHYFERSDEHQISPSGDEVGNPEFESEC
ncbi:hypothetical protein DENSPDRAFT_333145 [Dentipellis sp. KUC8613]|nr:hypothetical protein DENSPDRAFT_333145 [Dentipellis sp. KUC8613]